VRFRFSGVFPVLTVRENSRRQTTLLDMPEHGLSWRLVLRDPGFGAFAAGAPRNHGAGVQLGSSCAGSLGGCRGWRYSNFSHGRNHRFLAQLPSFRVRSCSQCDLYRALSAKSPLYQDQCWNARRSAGNFVRCCVYWHWDLCHDLLPSRSAVRETGYRHSAADHVPCDIPRDRAPLAGTRCARPSWNHARHVDKCRPTQHSNGCPPVQSTGIKSDARSSHSGRAPRGTLRITRIRGDLSRRLLVISHSESPKKARKVVQTNGSLKCESW